MLDYLKIDLLKHDTKYMNSKRIAQYLEHDNFGISKIDAESAIASVEGKFKEFIDLDSVHIISLNPLDAEKLMADYFNQNPPFESKKPYE